MIPFNCNVYLPTVDAKDSFGYFLDMNDEYWPILPLRICNMFSSQCVILHGIGDLNAFPPISGIAVK